MTSRKGGYIIIDLTSTTLVDDLSKALGFGKPVLVYNANNEANFYTLSYDDDNNLYILNGAKDSFSVDDDGDITPIVPVASAKVYKHNINISNNDNQIIVALYSTKSTALTFAEIYSLCENLVVMGADSAAETYFIGYLGVNSINNTIECNVSPENIVSFASTSTITDTIVEI